MISGKEALIALANGEEVQVKLRTIGKWVSIIELEEYKVKDMILNTHGDKFRLKPRTITLNSIEVPATFDPKEGEYYYHIELGNFCGYKKREMIAKTCIYSQVGVCRTEEEIKQVVEALRNVFNP